MHMTFQGVPEHERPTLHEEPLLEDTLEVGKEPFVSSEQAPQVEGFATAEQIKDASIGAAEKGFADMEQINSLNDRIAVMHLADAEKIKEITKGLSEKGFATPEQIEAVTTIALDQASNSMETTGRTNAKIAMEEAQAKLDAQEKPKKGIVAQMKNLLGLGSRKRQDSQDRFNRVN
jgi:hypothetical protein